MSDEETGPSSEVLLYIRIPGALARDFDVACAKLGIKRPEGASRAIETWLDMGPGKHPGQSMADPLGRRLKTHPRLLELLADANPEDLWKLEGYLEARRETRKRKGNG